MERAESQVGLGFGVAGRPGWVLVEERTTGPGREGFAFAAKAKKVRKSSRSEGHLWVPMAERYLRLVVQALTMFWFGGGCMQ